MEQAQVTIQITPTSLPSMSSWMGEVTAFAQILTHTGILKTIQEQVRFARTRCGHYDLIDFVAVLIGYVVSGELTLLVFYQRLLPWASPFMALFGRNQVPHRSTVSRFFAALDQPTVEAVRALFQQDLLACSPFPSSVACMIGEAFSGSWWLSMEPDMRLFGGTPATDLYYEVYSVTI